MDVQRTVQFQRASTLSLLGDSFVWDWLLYLNRLVPRTIHFEPWPFTLDLTLLFGLLKTSFCVFFASFYGFFLNRIARYGSCAFCIPFHSISFRSDLIKVLFLIKVKILLKPEMVSFAVTCGSKFIFKTRNHKTTINSIILYNLYNMLK